MHEHKAEAN